MPPGKLVVARTPFLALVGGLFATAAACDGALATSSSGTTTSSSSGGELDSGSTPVDAGGKHDATAGDAACEDDDGIPPSCDGFGSTQCTPAICEHYKAQYKSRVARRAIACVKEGASDACVTCGPTALAEACDDPSAADTCRFVDGFCTDAGRPNAVGNAQACRARLSGMTFGGRLSFVNCVTESLCSSSAHGVDACAR